MPSVIPAVSGSTSPDPGGFRAAGVTATGLNGQTLVWTGAEWQSLVSGAGISGATYDGSGRLTGYIRQGVVHTVSYPSSTTVVVSNTLGAEREVTLDGSGRVQAIA